jgi:hypothetical protein
LTAHYGGDLSAVYEHLRRDQDRDLTTHKISIYCLWGFASLAMMGFHYGWSVTELCVLAAVISLERSISWGTEVTSRNYAMHILTFQIQASKAKG